jgi:nitroimidazol reductase NimA-like FMN-containing flavoprotein (pyridoxamine 5'-phosphate oxidase superfamily)
MSTTFGELVANNYTAQLSNEELRECIFNFFKEQTMCMIATASSDGQPRATPLEFFAEGMTLYISADPGAKVENLKVNPKVGIAICNQINPDWSGDNWKTHKSVQIVGDAMLLEPDDPENTRAKKKVIKWQAFSAALGRDTSQPTKGWVIKVEPKKIEYFELALMVKGYAMTQVWEAPK